MILAGKWRKNKKRKAKTKKNQKATYRALSVTSCPWLRVYPLLTLHDRGLDFVFQTDHDTATELIINKDRPWCHLGWTNPEGNPPWILYFPLVPYIYIIKEGFSRWRMSYLNVSMTSLMYTQALFVFFESRF